MNSKKTVLLLISIILGVIIGVQIRTISKNMSMKTDEGILRTRELAEKIKNLDEEREKQRIVIEELNNKILKYENENRDVDAATKDLYDEIARLKQLACLTDVTGEGIELQIKPPSIKNNDNIFDNIIDNPEILLRIVSILNSADAEAISINGERISSYTEIERAGNSININGISISMPINIKAIGESKTLISALAIKNGVLDELRAYNYNCVVMEEDSVTVEKLKKVPKLRHSKALEM